LYKNSVLWEIFRLDSRVGMTAFLQTCRWIAPLGLRIKIAIELAL